ncbi:DUF2065 domain-containing protein [Candidatus Halobeggiatoa sp. HSG11]|nr:DUF2065 domain-containing protein [Candidatus Halobeggiatoa sp. HSG11]
MWEELGIAISLIFIIEGMLPFLNPTGWRKTLRNISEMDDSTLRTTGFLSMIFGVVLLYLVH